MARQYVNIINQNDLPPYEIVELIWFEWRRFVFYIRRCYIWLHGNIVPQLARIRWMLTLLKVAKDLLRYGRPRNSSKWSCALPWSEIDIQRDDGDFLQGCGKEMCTKFGTTSRDVICSNDRKNSCSESHKRDDDGECFEIAKIYWQSDVCRTIDIDVYAMRWQCWDRCMLDLKVEKPQTQDSRLWDGSASLSCLGACMD